VGGCEGPENNIGANGCHSCEKAIMNGHVPEGCLQKREPCPDGKSYDDLCFFAVFILAYLGQYLGFTARNMIIIL